MLSCISLQEKAWKKGVGTHVALGPDPAEVRQAGGSTSSELSSGGTECPRTGGGVYSVMGLCRGAHMMKIFTRLSRLQAQERQEPHRYKPGELHEGLMLTFRGGEGVKYLAVQRRKFPLLGVGLESTESLAFGLDLRGNRDPLKILHES